jgi:putative MATE family efflux protein
MTLISPRNAHDREILRLAVPAFGALVAEPLFLLADSAIVGHLGTAQQAGLGIAGTALTTVVGVCIFLAYGTTSSVARQVGAGNTTAAIRQGVDGVWLALALGVLLILAGLPLVAPVIDAFGAAPATVPYAETYLRVSLLGIPGLLVVLAGTGVLRGLQDTRTPLAVSVGSFTLNLLLNMLFVLVMGWGIAGSAAGTVVAQTAGAAVYVTMVVRKARTLGAPLTPDGAGVRSAATTGLAMVVRTIALQAVLLVATAASARLGTAEAAAYAVGSRVWSLLAFALDAIAIAGQAITGRFLGASDVAGTRAATRRMVEWGVGCGVAFGLAVLAVRPWLPGLFTHDPHVRTLLLSSLVVIALTQPISGAAFILDGVLIGAGDTRYLALAQTIALLVFLPAVWPALAAHTDLNSLWMAVAAWMTARLVTYAVRIRGHNWLVTGATR